MPERKVDTIYSMRNTNAVFAVSSILLTLVSAGIIWEDYSRQWKQYQRDFRVRELASTQEDLRAAAEYTKQEHADEIATINGRMQEAVADIARKDDRLKAAEKALAAAEAAHYPADQNVKFTKATLDVVRYEAELLEDEHAPNAERKKAEVDELSQQLAKSRLLEEEARSKVDEAQAQVDAIVGEKDELTKQMIALRRDQVRLEKKIASLEPSFQESFRNSPLLDFISPSIKIQQLIVPTLTDDIGFETHIAKVERCTTCHLAIDKDGWTDEGVPQPFRSHPRISVPKDAPVGTRPDFLSSTSPHPIDTFACSVCHGGQPRAVEFVRADHAPRDVAQKHEWEEKYGWEQDHYWDFPMRPIAYVESGCLKCHKSEVDIPHADKVSYGKRLFQRKGCFGCHNVSGLGFEQLRKVGPDLRHVRAKVDPDWMYRWIRKPRAFRPTTKMPQIFDLSNTSDPEEMHRSSVVISGIVTYLTEKSTDFPLPDDVPPGDATRGQELFESVGCRGCHDMGDQHNGANNGFESFGPNLAGVGSKLGPGWLYQWVKDPKAYFPDTRMPNLRLTDQEAADLATYLASLRIDDLPSGEPGRSVADTFRAVPKEDIDPALLDEMTTEQLHKTMPLDQARPKLASMSENDKLLLVGERAIARQGCFGCHMIPGFEDAQPIGTDLTDQGRKLVVRLDFGLRHDIPHTLHDFIWNKLKEPRQYDEGKLKLSEEKLKMPFFGFTDQEAEAITTFVLSLTKEPILEQRTRALDAREADIEAGRHLIAEKNCTGCHIIEGRGGDIRTYYQDEQEGNAPPILARQGAKVQSDWLFSFLKQPSPIRPWLHARMPTFDFSDEEARVLTRYFAAFDDVPYPFVSPDDKMPDADQLVQAEQLFAQCLNCHVAGDVTPPKDPSYLAPDLLNARTRLRAKWIADWLTDPQSMLPGTRMPNFFYDEGNPLFPDADARIVALRHVMFTADPDAVMAQARERVAAAEADGGAEAESYE